MIKFHFTSLNIEHWTKSSQIVSICWFRFFSFSAPLYITIIKILRNFVDSHTWARIEHINEQPSGYISSRRNFRLKKVFKNANALFEKKNKKIFYWNWTEWKICWCVRSDSLFSTEFCFVLKTDSYTIHAGLAIHKIASRKSQCYKAS